MFAKSMLQWLILTQLVLVQINLRKQLEKVFSQPLDKKREYM